MSDVNQAADELEREDECADEAAEPATAASAAQPETAACADAGQPELELPDGANLMQMLIEAQKEARAAQDESQAHKDGMLRARAEFANYKKRTERERAETYQRAAHDTLSGLLPIIDDFERAFDSVPDMVSGDAWFGGVEMIQRKFMTLLEQHAVEALDPTGELFDPQLHQAIGAEDSDEVESGHVIETLMKGYRAGDKVLRLAMVKVAT